MPGQPLLLNPAVEDGDDFLLPNGELLREQLYPESLKVGDLVQLFLLEHSCYRFLPVLVAPVQQEEGPALTSSYW